MTKKPYYKLVIGKAPYTSVDMKFTCGRILIKVSNAWPDAKAVFADLFETNWTKACKKVFTFWENSPVSLADYNAELRVELTEPADRPLKNEVGA